MSKVIDALNVARSMELFSIHQYMVEHYKLDDLGLEVLANSIKRIAIEEMRHAEKLAERIRELGGIPTSQLSQTVNENVDVLGIFVDGQQTEMDTIKKYNEIRNLCQNEGDTVSMKLMEELSVAENNHESYFGDIAYNIRSYGEEFLAKCAIKAYKNWDKIDGEY